MQNIILYGCEIWSLTVWREHRLSALENGALRRIFGCNRCKVMGVMEKIA
jgi:hypothetical protein